MTNDMQPQSPDSPGDRVDDVENGLDPTPAPVEEPVGETYQPLVPGAVPGRSDEHLPWMRPSDGEVHLRPEYEPVPFDETPSLEEPHEPAPVDEVVREGDSPDVLLTTDESAALVGARAAEASEDEPGTSLDHAPTTPEPEPEPGPAPLQRLWPWLAGALALGMVAFGVIFSQTHKSPVVVTQTPTPTPTVAPVVNDGDLAAPVDGRKLDAKRTWKASLTEQKLSPTSPRPVCLLANPGQPNPTLSKLRVLAADGSDGMQLLHQVDAYATATDAQKVFQLREGNLANCYESPTYLVRADKVTGLGDEAVSMTVAFQDPVTQYDTVLLVRTGTTVHVFDAVKHAEFVGAKEVANAAAGPIARQCTRAKGSCDDTPEVSPTPPPPAGLPGWLILPDLPRVTPGAGAWTATDPTAVTTKGSYCEAMTLATVTGPTGREQRTYLLGNDPAAPQNFGVDEVLLTFAKPADAKAFADKLVQNLSTCPKRMLTAKIGDTGTFRGKVDGTDIQGTTLLVTQATGPNQNTLFRVGVATSGNRVVYLLNNSTKAYDLKLNNFRNVLIRGASRAAQAR